MIKLNKATINYKNKNILINNNINHLFFFFSPPILLLLLLFSFLKLMKIKIIHLK